MSAQPMIRMSHSSFDTVSKVLEEENLALRQENQSLKQELFSTNQSFQLLKSTFAQLQSSQTSGMAALEARVNKLEQESKEIAGKAFLSGGGAGVVLSVIVGYLYKRLS